MAVLVNVGVLVSVGVGVGVGVFVGVDVYHVPVGVGVGVEVGCKLGNITVLRKLGAPLVSSMLAVRLVAALILGWFILGEQLSSLVQWGGVILVVVTITAYLTSLSQSELKVIVSEISPGDS